MGRCELTIKGLVDEDFVNYKKPSMFIAMPKCTWKCEKECGKRVCQNGSLANSPDIYVKREELVQRYIGNPITKAVVFGGLEPFDSYPELVGFISELRKHTDDEVVIYTGYYEQELGHRLNDLESFVNIIIKFGRYIPNRPSVYSELLGVELASDNQYAKKIS